jgi:hypothetical protein
VVRVNPLNPLLVALSLALAAMAIPAASADGLAPPEPPEKPVRCTFPTGDTDCVVTAGPCWAHTHMYDVEDALNVYEAYCFGCGVRLGGGDPIRCDPLEDLVAEPQASPSAAAPSAQLPPQPCTAGFAQTWCDFTVGPCFVRVTPWTAWGDRYVVSDCRIGGGAGTTCHTEVHTMPPDHEHSCAFASARPCQDISAPPHAGFDCTVAGVHCAVYIWLDLNPPNPTWDCLT